MRIKTVIKRVVIGIAIFFGAIFVFGIILQLTGYQPPAKTEPVQDAVTEAPPQQPDEPVEPTQTDIISGIIETGSDESSTEANTLPNNIQVQKPVPPLFKTVKSFRNTFNKAASENRFNFKLPNLKVQNGEVNNVFQCKITDSLIIMGTVDKKNKGVKEISMLARSDGTLESFTNLFLCMAVIMASADSSLLPEQRGDILRDLGFLGADNNTIMDISTKTEKNGLEYFINTSPLIGIIFGVSRK
jgi:hypothetical protein